MSAFFMWLAANSFAGYTFIALAAVLALLLIISYSAALIQGRSISYWPPKIGERLPDNLRKSPVDHSSRIADRGDAGQLSQDTIKIMWTSPAPDAEQLLRRADHSALIVGTSLFRIVHSDLFTYRDWLRKKDERLLALMFLNPYSPHAIGRERRDVHRSSADSILDSLRTAHVEARKNPQIIPVVYDGPFRYTARAVDIGDHFESADSSISIVTSSHGQGISKGFQITLTKSECTESYSHYQRELIDLWMQSLANPPGHGISIIGRGDELSDPDLTTRKLSRLPDALASRNSVGHIFEPHQLHMTLSALCRTQVSPLYGPLTIGSANSQESLPEHFGQFACDVLNESRELFQNEMMYRFSRVTVDARGYIKLMAAEQEHEALSSTVSELLVQIGNAVGDYASKYPDESWSAAFNDGREQRFGPKVQSFVPHITLGMAFRLGHSLPLPLRDRHFSIELDDPIVVRFRDFSIIHYAYRSLFRNVGKYPISRLRSGAPGELEVLQLLGISVC